MDAQHRIALEFHSLDDNLVSQLFASMPQHGSRIEIVPGAFLEYKGIERQRGALPGMPEIIHVVLGIGTGVLTKVLADWLYGRIKGRSQIVQIRVNRSIVEISPEGLARAIHEATEIHIKKV